MRFQGIPSGSSIVAVLGCALLLASAACQTGVDPDTVTTQTQDGNFFRTTQSGPQTIDTELVSSEGKIIFVANGRPNADGTKWVFSYGPTLDQLMPTTFDIKDGTELAGPDRFERVVGFHYERTMGVKAHDNMGCDSHAESCEENGACCDVHDACYKKYGCTSDSWTDDKGPNPEECDDCNHDVMQCIFWHDPGKACCCTLPEFECGKPQNCAYLRKVCAKKSIRDLAKTLGSDVDCTKIDEWCPPPRTDATEVEGGEHRSGVIVEF